jgi:anti-sigma B factor antagonist
MPDTHRSLSQPGSRASQPPGLYGALLPGYAYIGSRPWSGAQVVCHLTGAVRPLHKGCALPGFVDELWRALMRESWLPATRPDAQDAEDVPATFSVDVQPERDLVRVYPVGDLDLATVGQVRAQLEELQATGFSRLILDLRRTTFLDSSALHMVVEIHTAAANDGFEFAIAPGPPTVQRAFELTGLDTRLPFTRPCPGENGRARAEAEVGRTPSRK